MEKGAFVLLLLRNKTRIVTSTRSTSASRHSTHQTRRKWSSRSCSMSSKPPKTSRFPPIDAVNPVWTINHWEDPLTKLGNQFQNDRVTIRDDQPLQLLVQFFKEHHVMGLAIERNVDWMVGMELVLDSHALTGLAGLGNLMIQNFAVRFRSAEWLRPNATLNTIRFMATNMTGFILDSSTEIETDVLFKDSTMDTFPASLLLIRRPPQHLIIENCNITKPVTMSRKMLGVLQNISTTFSGNTVGELGSSSSSSFGSGLQCVDTAMIGDIKICVIDNTMKAALPLPGSKPRPLDKPTVAPFDDKGTVKSSSQLTSVLVATACIVGGALLVVGFIFMRRRQPQTDDQPIPSPHTGTRGSNPFYGNGDLDPEADIEALAVCHVDAKPRNSEQESNKPAFGSVDLGEHSVKPDVKLGAKGLWRCDLRGTLVIAKRVHLATLRDQGFDIKSTVAKLETLRHPNITKFIGVCAKGRDDVMLVTEFMAKGSLRSILAQHDSSLSWEKIICMMHQAASSLAYVHSSDRIITTKDYLCDSDFNCKLDILNYADLPLDHAPADLTFGAGGIAYYPPEVLRGDALTPAGIVYALGVIMCELTRRGLLHEEVVDEMGTALGEIHIMKEVLAGRLAPEPARDSPEELQVLIQSCTAFNPNERPSIEDVVRALDALLT
ncbi:hypothetical protein PINS_up001368 [Pythium insidiosum]|nr:hypothetical protein PINS_up001368 [Pythium insidiosum]